MNSRQRRVRRRAIARQKALRQCRLGFPTGTLEYSDQKCKCDDMPQAVAYTFNRWPKPRLDLSQTLQVKYTNLE